MAVDPYEMTDEEWQEIAERLALINRAALETMYEGDYSYLAEPQEDDPLTGP